MSKFIIVGAGEFAGFKPEHALLENREEYFIIAADGGYDHIQKHYDGKIKPNLLVGDLDSITEPNLLPELQTRRFPCEKNASDLELAVDIAFERVPSQVQLQLYIYGALGGRLDHTLANIALLGNLSKKRPKSCFLIGNNERLTAVTDGKLTLSPPPRSLRGVGSGVNSDIRFVSIFPVGIARGVKITGLKYTLDGVELSQDVPTIGLSNEFIGVTAEISIECGTLIVVLNY
ncbi:MAG: thiamine diphosphokinase [Oscillospiraceae bacterium]|nr:thiamine diphosphokinase [Oscillospiraceae bacterium]